MTSSSTPDSSDQHSGLVCEDCGTELHVVTYFLPHDGGLSFQGICPKCDNVPPPEDVITPDDVKKAKKSVPLDPQPKSGRDG